MLAAQGIWIPGVLSFALYLSGRRDQSSLRNVNILWNLEQNSQEKGVACSLATLQATDPGIIGAPVSINDRLSKI